MNVTTRRPRPAPAGSYFALDRAVHAELIARNASAGVLATMLVLGAASDAANETSRAGIQAIRKYLGVGPATAQSYLDGLIQHGAIAALPLTNRRDMTAARYRLARPSRVTDPELCSNPEADYTISNDLVRGALGQRFLRRVVLTHDRPLLDLLLDLHADPLGMGPAPRVMRYLYPTEVGRLGALILAKCPLAGIDSAGPLFEDIGLRGDARRVDELVDFGLVEWGVHSAYNLGGAISLFDPIATLRRGIICRDTPDAAIPALSKLLITSAAQASILLTNDLPIVRSAHDDGLALVAIPRLTIVPRTAQISGDEQYLRAQCLARVEVLQGILRAAFPGVEARINDILTAAAPGT